MRRVSVQHRLAIDSVHLVRARELEVARFLVDGQVFIHRCGCSIAETGMNVEDKRHQYGIVVMLTVFFRMALAELLFELIVLSKRSFLALSIPNFPPPRFNLVCCPNEYNTIPTSKKVAVRWSLPPPEI
jgi:hypothetical protein